MGEAMKKVIADLFKTIGMWCVLYAIVQLTDWLTLGALVANKPWAWVVLIGTSGVISYFASKTQLVNGLVIVFLALVGFALASWVFIYMGSIRWRSALAFAIYWVPVYAGYLFWLHENKKTT